jgi:putative hydrolase of the HAD superfamily
LHSSHTYGYAKESQNFWNALQEEVGFDRETTLFVDDSLPVLRSAREYGIGMLVSVTQPDTTEPSRPTTEFRSVQRVADLLDIR